MATTPGVPARDNDRAGKASLKYDGHNRAAGNPDREQKWRKWRRSVRAWLRQRRDGE